MKKYKILFSAAAIFLLIISTLGGCTYDPARRYIQTDPNDMASPNTPTIPNNVVGKAGNNAYSDKISATYEMVDFSYITPKGGNLNVRTGAGTKFPSIGTIKSGQKVRALGKLDGWYVVTMPDSGKIGCIPAANARPYGTTTGTDTTGTGTVTPSTAQNTTGAGTTGAGTAGGGTTAAGSGTMSSDESKILQLVNAERAKNGAKALSSSSDCTKLARMKSQDMVNNNYFSHQSPTYGSPFDMLKSNNVSYMYAGENIAMNQSAEAAFQAWMNSEGHKKNILNPNFTELGVGIASKGNGSYIYTQLFIGR
ncbi:MAG: CAP domain-containing protein [Clostridiaceae bacterium]|jgi:uncharacterized YkwD family protein|nr:CAP domain-containing protein [Clostridiaceae bacterium]